jgi:hypothetical protein
VAIKTARELALMPYSVRTGMPGPGERRGGERQARPSRPVPVEETAEPTGAPELEIPSEEGETLVRS